MSGDERNQKFSEKAKIRSDKLSKYKSQSDVKPDPKPEKIWIPYHIVTSFLAQKLSERSIGGYPAHVLMVWPSLLRKQGTLINVSEARWDGRERWFEILELSDRKTARSGLMQRITEAFAVLEEKGVIVSKRKGLRTMIRYMHPDVIEELIRYAEKKATVTNAGALPSDGVTNAGALSRATFSTLDGIVTNAGALLSLTLERCSHQRWSVSRTNAGALAALYIEELCLNELREEKELKTTSELTRARDPAKEPEAPKTDLKLIKNDAPGYSEIKGIVQSLYDPAFRTKLDRKPHDGKLVFKLAQTMWERGGVGLTKQFGVWLQKKRQRMNRPLGHSPEEIEALIEEWQYETSQYNAGEMNA